MLKNLTVAAAICGALPALAAAAPAESPDEIERAWKAGRTLPLEVSARHPLPKLRLRGDRGINVLVDLAHQCLFATMWSLPSELHRTGFRAVGSQATLDTVLTPGKPSRIRVRVGGHWPFGWWANARYNVVMTHQGGPESQDYLPEERAALRRYVEAGGGLVIIGSRARSAKAAEGWTLNALAKQFGGALTERGDKLGGDTAAVLRLDPRWEIVERGAAGQPVVAKRESGKGRVVLVGSLNVLRSGRSTPADEKKARAERLVSLVAWAAGGSKPVGGEPRLPAAMAGGGGIYPELEQRVGNMVVYYARNQKPELLKTVREDLPAVGKQLQAWLPSPVPEEPMFLVLSAGGGGGWAVNAYLPKEVGVISLSRLGIISIFAHELAHTMSGPRNAKGRTAGNWAHGNQGESHAGWFQGKIVAKYTDNKFVKNCNNFFRFDPKGGALDLAAAPGELRRKWGKGKEWGKIWWVWQKLDDRYGPTWYPRWRWVQYTRWQGQPSRRLSWDDMVEDMSIAVGEDLVPFFRAIGTTLKRDRLERIAFQGRTIDLPVAPLTVTPAGKAKLGPIGDFRQPLAPRPPAKP